MRFTILALLPIIMAVAADVGPAPPSSNENQGHQEHQNPSISKAQADYSGGEIACCKNKEEIKADGILGNLLAKGLLNNVLGVGDSACAKFSLIENLNILGFTKEGVDGTSCSESTAYCPYGGDQCQLIS